ncbi:MAG: hypothetical protein AYK18_06720 [Theionarchaea archaeon DG-70]|nr:MAG: hypothetical protein AYK18_06720 [Theionarchaea archaeon DG-70]
MRAAEKWLEEARKDLGGEAFNSSLISSYLAMFHSARAILFFDGFREKGHYCIARYLGEKYAKKELLETKWIELLDYYRDMRHNDQYSTSFFATEKEAKKALKSAQGFVETMRKLLERLSLQ